MSNLFSPWATDPVRGVFLRRLNRFVVECDLNGRPVSAHLANPGRLWELLLPGATVFLIRRGSVTAGGLMYSAVAVERDGVPILLHTQMANRVARHLLESNRVPGLEDTKIVKAEATVGHSRFDFHLLQRGCDILCEVKSCTLFGKSFAMFPDAVTERGRRHLMELAELADRGFHCVVIYLIHWSGARYFLPDFHTDPDFSRIFREVRHRVRFCPLSVGWSSSLHLLDPVREVDIPWSVLEREDCNRGSYLLILNLASDRSIDVGRLGSIFFPAGYYIYVGSAQKNLSQRVNRHLRRKKKPFWHIDYLRNHADSCVAVPIRSSENLEHELAGALGKICGRQIPDFGSSDCRCPTHLFSLPCHPLRYRPFIALLQTYRMDRLEDLVEVSR
ncbi:MAG: DNA/RNA nuclease SfsA [Deltaproteobacteria bacterium]|jgi:sugar fermentation stimulation protein A|nr:DNA/RNA nuclease SfsA [Deltaproteobacteria bacterium]